MPAKGMDTGSGGPPVSAVWCMTHSPWALGLVTSEEEPSCFARQTWGGMEGGGGNG